MNIAPFAIEEYFALYEFNVPYNLCASDCETISVAELLSLGDATPDMLGRLRLGYTESQGDPALRGAIAATYERVQAEDVVVVTAPEEGVYLTMRTLLRPGDDVIVMAPAYNSLRNLAEHICGPERVKAWEVEPTASGWRLDLARLEELITPQTRLLIVNFPHNPTGVMVDAAGLQQMVETARRHDLWLFCDEMYRGLELGETQRLPSAADLYERSIALSGLSKVHGLPGLRSGWLVVGDEDVRGRLVNWKHYTTICAPAPSEFLARAALEVQDQLIARNRRLVEENLALADAFFARWPDLFTWRRPQAGSIALVGVHVPSTVAYCEALAQAAGVLLLPGPYLGYDDRHVRFGFGRADFPAALAHYEAHLQRERS